MAAPRSKDEKRVVLFVWDDSLKDFKAWDGTVVGPGGTGLALESGGNLEAITNLIQEEDVPHVSGDKGTMLLGVRTLTSASALSDTNGDYEPIHLDGSGNLMIAIRAGTNVANVTANRGDDTSNNVNRLEVYSYNFGWDGANWDRIRNDSVDGLLVNLGTNNDITGDIAHDAVDAGNPLKIGGYGSTAAPTAVADGDRVNWRLDTRGSGVVIGATTAGVLTPIATSALQSTGNAYLSNIFNYIQAASGQYNNSILFGDLMIFTGAEVKNTNVLNAGKMTRMNADGLGNYQSVIVDQDTNNAARVLTESSDSIAGRKLLGVAAFTNRSGQAYVPNWEGGIDISGGSVTAVLGVGATSPLKSEDSTFINGEYGMLQLGRRRDAPAIETSTDGDHSALTTDDYNRLWTRNLPDFQTRSDTYTAVAAGTTVTALTRPVKYFSLESKGTNTQVGTTVWTIALEVSMDDTNWTTLISHVYPTDADGVTKTYATSPFPALYFRSNCTALTLGTATNVVTTIIGMN